MIPGGTIILVEKLTDRGNRIIEAYGAFTEVCKFYGFNYSTLIHKIKKKGLPLEIGCIRLHKVKYRTFIDEKSGEETTVCPKTYRGRATEA